MTAIAQCGNDEPLADWTFPLPAPVEEVEDGVVPVPEPVPVEPARPPPLESEEASAADADDREAAAADDAEAAAADVEDIDATIESAKVVSVMA